jgi:hypothetical protein
MDLRARIRVGEVEIPCRVVDVSATGAGVCAPVSEALRLAPDTEIELVLKNRALGRISRLRTRIKRAIPMKGIGKANCLLVGLEFAPNDLSERRDIVGLVFGDSELLKANLFRRQRAVGVPRSLWFLLRTGAFHAAGHVGFLLNPLVTKVLQPLHLWRRRIAKKVFTDTREPAEDFPAPTADNETTLDPAIKSSPEIVQGIAQ